MSPFLVFAQVEAGRSAETVRSARGLLSLVVICLVILLLAIIALALLRAGRRARQNLVRRPGKATDTGDVWTRHRLPEDADQWLDEER